MLKLSHSPFLVFALLSSALAQDAASQGAADQKEKKLPGINTVVIVTDTKTDEPQENITQKVNVIYDDQIAAQATSVRNISELLQYQPGVSVTVLSRNDANWGSYGGLGPKYNSYLLDGLPIDSFVDTMSLDPWAFERIETHQGPASVMYSNYLSADFAGTQAPLAGISNLVLKERIDKPETRILLGRRVMEHVRSAVLSSGSQGQPALFPRHDLRAVGLHGLRRAELMAGHAGRSVLQEDEVLRKSHILRGQPSEILGFRPAYSSQRIHRTAQPRLRSQLRHRERRLFEPGERQAEHPAEDRLSQL